MQFVGRTGELSELREALEASLAGRGGARLVAGEPGIGKTRLAREFSAEAERRGALVVWGRAWEAGGAPALWPWTEVLRALRAEIGHQAFAAAVEPAASDLGPLLPELRARAESLDDAAALPDSDEGRFRLFDAVAAGLERLARVKPIVLVLDDLHAADTATILLARFVARRAAVAPVLVIGLYRESEGRGRPQIGDLERDAGLRPLRGLDHADVGVILERTLGHAPADVVDAVHERTDGNPLFVHGIARLLTATGDAARDIAAGAIPRDVRDAIEQRLRSLSPKTRDVLAAGAVIGRHFDAAMVARVLGARADEVVAALDEASAAGILAEAAPGAQERSFVHALYHEVVYESPPEEERQRRHTAVAETLERLHADDLTPHLATLAFHFDKAGHSGDARRAFDYSRRAGDDAMARFSFEEAARQYERALGLISRARAGDDERLDVTLRLGRAELRASDPVRGMATLDEAARLARALGRWRVLAVVALELAPDQAAVTGEAAPLARLSEALDAVGNRDRALRARLLARSAIYSRYVGGQAERGTAYAREALEIARALDDPGVLGEALLAWVTMLPATPDLPSKQLPLVEEILEIARRSDDLEMEMQARIFKMTCLLDLANRAAWEHERAEHHRLAQRIRMPILLWYDAMLGAARASLEAHVADFDRLANEALELGSAAGRPEALFLYGGQVATRWMWEGDFSVIASRAEIYRSVAAAKPDMALYRVAVAAVEVELGNIEHARAEFMWVSQNDFEELPRDRGFVISVMVTGEFAVRIDDREVARRAYATLRPFEDLFVVSARGVAPLAPAARHLGLLASFLGEHDEAQRYFEKALDIARRLASPPQIAHVQDWYAHALAGRGRPGDLATARTLCQSAATTFERLALTTALERATTFLKELDERDAGQLAPKLRRQGEYWTATYGGVSVSVRGSKGIDYIVRLVDHPGREIHSLELVAEVPAAVAQESTAPVLDARAKKEIRDRIRALEEDIDEAERFGDLERAAKARAEIEQIGEALSAAIGLGGRDRPLGSMSERARVNATRVIRAAIERIERHHPALGEHLARSIRTGTFCRYDPSEATGRVAGGGRDAVK